MALQSLLCLALFCLTAAAAANDPAWQGAAAKNILKQQPKSLAEQAISDAGFFPHYLGPIIDVQNAGVKGEVYFVNSTTIKIAGLTLPTGPPAPLFWVDYHHLLSGQGVHLPSDKYGYNILGTYDNEDVYVTIPVSDQFPTVLSYKSFGVWCAKFFVNFAYISWQ
uniref:DM13 domain-containing protein n=1 Tax=Plectus sambesii TaxID=2011161 RepID=A0A914X2X5_9BILA